MLTTPRPYKIRPRAFEFACEVVRSYPGTRLDPPGLKVWGQLIAAATSTGAHLEEASAGGSRAQFLSLIRGALREMRETNYWLRIIAATELAGYRQVGPLIKESQELVAILATIVRSTYENGGKRRTKTNNGIT
jgi:four helix bundle protein